MPALAGSQLDGSTESRFAQLLQPIKDLTKNWDVDIAAYLEDYLEELEQMTISFDGGVTTMNFAQAAMLVQSSACVYSKKVEFLYSLMYQVLDMLANKKKQAQKSSVDSEGNDQDADFQEDNDEEFLCLDDVDEGKNLYLKEDFEANEPFKLLPEMPLCLIPLEEGEKGENPLLSKSGEVLASRTDFKMNTCCVHPQGTLLLDLSHIALLEQSLRQAEELLAQCAATRSAVNPDPGTGVEGEEGNDFPQLMSVDDNDGDAFPGAGDEVDGSLPMEDLPPSDTQTVPGDGLRRSERRRPVIAAVKPVVDPLKPLDSHEQVKPGKPFHARATSWKQCPGLDEKTKKRKKKDCVQNERPQQLKEYKTIFYSEVKKFPNNPLKRPTFSLLEQRYWAEFKRRQAVLSKQQMQKKRDDRAALAVEEEEDDDKDSGDVLGVGLDPAGGFHIDDEDDAHSLGADDIFDAIERGLENHRSFNNRLQRGIHGDTEEDGIITSYEKLVRKHVEDFMASAQEYAQITELSKRVAEWEDKVLPRLQEEENHEPFDIHKYGSDVIGNIHRGSRVQFQHIVQGKPIYEICRTFLASLMLANTTNVRIEEKGELEAGMDKFELELLSTKRHFEELQDYNAPSLEK